MNCVCEQVQELFVKFILRKADCEGHAVSVWMPAYWGKLNCVI